MMDQLFVKFSDYEVTSRALSAICEVASETCTAWLSRQESN